MQLLKNPNKDIQACSLYRLKSIHKLAEILEIDRREIERLANDERLNYRIYQTKGEKGRTIEEPPPALKPVQRRLHNILSRLGPPEYLYSAFRGRSAVGNAQQHEGNCPIVKVDIKKFFPSSDGSRVWKFFKEELQCAGDVAAILQKICTIAENDNPSESHLPTGGVTSSILSYFCYRGMFDELYNYAKSRNLVFTVMADDLTFSGIEADSKAAQFANETIKEHGLRPNFKKQKVWDASHTSKIVTGAVVTPKGIRVSRPLKKKIEVCQEKLKMERNPLKRSSLYKVLIGLFTAAAQVERRYSSAINIVKTDWRRDRSAWSAHKIASSIRPKI